MVQTVRSLVLAWLALLVLLVSTVGAAMAPIGAIKPALSFVIATAKAAVVLWLFMEVRRLDWRSRVALAIGAVWLAFLLGLSLLDLVSTATG